MYLTGKDFHKAKKLNYSFCLFSKTAERKSFKYFTMMYKTIYKSTTILLILKNSGKKII